MKISVFGIPALAPGKHNIKDPRLDEVDSITKSKKKTYLSVELCGEEGAFEADAIVALKDSRLDLVLKDIEFVETRLSRSEDEKEKVLLNKLKSHLEKEELVFNIPLSPEERSALTQYSLLTNKPVILAQQQEAEDAGALLARAVKEGGYISFFTTGDKETRAWLIKKGATAWEASGAIHSDIQRGFIRAEIISFEDFIKHNGETGAKQAGKMRLEQKDYVMQDADLSNFRFNK